MRVTGWGMRGARCEVWVGGTGCGVCDMAYEIRGARYAIRDSRCGARGMRCRVCDMMGEYQR